MTETKIEISPIAYIKSLMYFQRFANDFIHENTFKVAYGLLRGFIDVDKKMYIEDFIPIKDFEKEYIIFEEYERIFENIERLDKEYDDDEYPEYILGWARNALYDNLEPTLIDKKNQLIFQTAIHPRSFFWIFDHDSLAIGDGFSLYAFKDDIKAINIISELIEVSYNFTSDVYFDDIVQLAINIEEKRKNKEILIKGIEEI